MTTIHLIGPVGAGKTLLLVGLYLHLFRRDSPMGREGTFAPGRSGRKDLGDRFELLEASSGLLRQVETVLQARETDRTPTTEVEFLRVRWFSRETGAAGRELLFVSYPGEYLRMPTPREGEAVAEDRLRQVINPVELRRNLESGDALLAPIMNGFCWQELGDQGLLGLTAWWQEKCQFPFANAVALSAELLWGLTQEGLARLDTGYDDLSAETLEKAVIAYHPEAGSREEQFTVEGVSEAEGRRVLRVLRTLATLMSQIREVDFITLAEIADKVRRKVAVITRAGLLPFVRCLHQEDFDPVFDALLGPDEDRLASQQVLAPLWRVTLRNNVRRPIRKVEIQPSGGERFWMGVRRQLLRPIERELGTGAGAVAGSNRWQRFGIASAAFAGVLAGLLVTLIGVIGGVGPALGATLLLLLLGSGVFGFYVSRVQVRRRPTVPLSTSSGGAILPRLPGPALPSVAPIPGPTGERGHHDASPQPVGAGSVNGDAGPSARRSQRRK